MMGLVLWALGSECEDRVFWALGAECGGRGYLFVRSRGLALHIVHFGHVHPHQPDDFLDGSVVGVHKLVPPTRDRKALLEAGGQAEGVDQLVPHVQQRRAPGAVSRLATWLAC